MAADGSVVFSIGADDAEAQKKLIELRKDIEKLEKGINSATEKRSGIAESLAQAREEAEQTAQRIQELQSEMSENQQYLSGFKGNIDVEEFNARTQAQKEMTYELAIQEKLYAKQQATVSSLEAKEADLTSQIETQTAKLSQQRDEAGAVERVLARQSTTSWPQISTAIEGVNKSIKKGVRNILKWGFGIRSAFILMRRLRSAIKEGINTFAEYDEETKNNINSLKNSLQGLKAAWGAAFAPILNAVAPILHKLIDLLVTAANYVQMFFSVLRGGTTYKKVIANNEALAKSYGGAGGAAKDAKKQVMAFDEINKLDSQESGGGGGGGGSNAIEGVDEELIPEKLLTKLEWVRDHLKEILAIAGAVGLALLAWKIATSLGANLLGLWNTFKLVLGVIMAIAGAIILVKNGIDAWNNGVNLDNLIGMLEGALLLVVGLGLAFGATGAAIGGLIAGVALLVVGLRDWIKTGELSTETFYMLEAGILLVGGAIALLTGGWIPLIIAAVVGLVLAVYKYWDKIKAALSNAWQFIKAWWQDKVVAKLKEGAAELRGDWERIKQSAENIKNSVVNTFNALVSRVSTIFSAIKESIVGKFQDARDRVFEIVQNIKDKFANLHIQLPHIALPHIQVTWTDTSQSSIARLLGITKIPDFYIKWAAKGGIVDGATLIGAGEAGKEAIVPLERNTEWIRMVANGIIDGLTGNNKFADYISGTVIPAIANGQIVPPRALSGGGSVFTDGDIQKLVNGLTAALSADGNEQSIKLYLDGRQVAETVTKHQRRMERGYA